MVQRAANTILKLSNIVSFKMKRKSHKEEIWKDLTGDKLVKEKKKIWNTREEKVDLT